MTILNKKEVAARLNMSVNTLNGIIKNPSQGFPPAIDIPGRHFRFDSDVIDAWVASRGARDATPVPQKPAKPSGRTPRS